MLWDKLPPLSFAFSQKGCRYHLPLEKSPMASAFHRVSSSHLPKAYYFLSILIYFPSGTCLCPSSIQPSPREVDEFRHRVNIRQNAPSMTLAKSVFTTFLRSLTVRNCQEFQEGFLSSCATPRHSRRIRTGLRESAIGDSRNRTFLSSFPRQNCHILRATQANSVTTHPLHCHCTFADVFADSGSLGSRISVSS